MPNVNNLTIFGKSYQNATSLKVNDSNGNTKTYIDPNMQSKTATPGASAVTVTPDNGYDGLSQVTVNTDANLLAENIKKDVTIFGVTGTYEGGGSVNTLILYATGYNSDGYFTSTAYIDSAKTTTFFEDCNSDYTEVKSRLEAADRIIIRTQETENFLIQFEVIYMKIDTIDDTYALYCAYPSVFKSGVPHCIQLNIY